MNLERILTTSNYGKNLVVKLNNCFSFVNFWKLLCFVKSKNRKKKIQIEKNKNNSQDMECYTNGPTTPNNSSTFYDNNNYGDQQLSNEHHNQHYYGYPCQNYMEPLCPVQVNLFQKHLFLHYGSTGCGVFKRGVQN